LEKPKKEKAKSSTVVFENTKFLDKCLMTYACKYTPEAEEFVGIWMVLVFFPSCLTVLFTITLYPSYISNNRFSVADYIYTVKKEKKDQAV
jgi:hypothetical protein